MIGTNTTAIAVKKPPFDADVVSSPWVRNAKRPNRSRPSTDAYLRTTRLVWAILRNDTAPTTANAIRKRIAITMNGPIPPKPIFIRR